jgi:hypothetical protein
MFRIILVLICLCSLAAAASACGGDSESSQSDAPTARAGGPTFDEVKLATEIDPQSKEPITEVTSFRSDTKAMHAAIFVRNVPAGSEFRFRWTKGVDEAATIVVNVPAFISESWVAASITPNRAVPPGDDWLIVVAFNGRQVSSKTFSVN